MATNRMLATGPPRTYAVVLDSGDAVVDTMLRFAEDNRLQAASLTAIGAFSRATLAYFDLETKRYQDIPVDEQVEVLALTGDIVRGEDGDADNGKDTGWRLHAHAVVGRRDGTTRGGHLRDAVVRPTLEVMVTESPRQLTRRYDESSGLALIDLDASPPITGTAAGQASDQIS